MTERRGVFTELPRAGDAVLAALLARARRDAAATELFLQRAATRRAHPRGRRSAGDRADVEPVRRELRRLGGTRLTAL